MLEAENQLGRHCGGKDRESACARTLLKPKAWEFPVYGQPFKAQRELGHLRLVVTPGVGVEMYWMEIGASKGIRFEPDDGVGDWGYGSPFLMTVLDVQGSWVQMPRRPFTTPVWIEVSDLRRKPELLMAKDLGVLTLDGRDIVVIDVDGDELIVRDEQPADMWCESGPAPALIESDTFRVSIKDVYDADMHLKLRGKYKRGC